MVARWCSMNRDPLGEKADGSRRRGSWVVTRNTGGRAEGHGRSWSEAEVPAGSESGRGVPTEEAELAVPLPSEDTKVIEKSDQILRV